MKVNIVLMNFFILLFVDMKYFVNKRFNSGRYRHRKNKKLLIKFHKILGLIFNNNSIQNLEKSSEINAKFQILTRRITDYNNILKPYFYYIKNLELIAILALILSFILPFLNLEMTISFIKDNFRDIIIVSFLLFLIILTPVREDMKRKEMNKIHKKVRKKIGKIIEEMKCSHLIFVTNSELSMEKNFLD